MTVAEISHAIQSIGFLTYVRESGYTYPMILSIHLTAIAVFGGLILMTDARILGWALTDVPVAHVVRSLRRWKVTGFLIMVLMGLLLGLSEMDKYYANPYFLIKMVLLWIVFPIHALIFRGPVYSKPEALDAAPTMPGIAKAAAISSLCLWIAIACCGRWIAYYEPKDKNGKPVAALTVPAPAPVAVVAHR
jgi:hypothetical protein